MFESLKIGRPFGINTYIHPTFWLLPAFVFLSGMVGSGSMDAAVLDVAVLFAIFGCVALHELGHALAARLYGIRTRDIVLYPIGGVARLERMPSKPWQEIVVALAGPAVNVGIVALMVPVLWASGFNLSAFGYADSAAELFLNRVMWGNVFLAAFNLLPAFPMDGGRVLRAVLAMGTDRVTATRFAAGVGTVFAALFAIWGLWPNGGGLMFVLLAFFLYTTGRAELANVQGEEDDRAYYESVRRRVPTVRPADVWRNEPADGWQYDPHYRAWVEWRNGRPVRMVQA
jgi:Zn-dependent protease